MFTIWWLIIWLLEGTPALHQWNNWLIALIIVIIIDLIGGREVI